jgi:hypothetical protein
MNKADFSQGLTMLEATTGRKVPAEQASAWFRICSDLTLEQWEAGISETLKTNTFAGLPPIGLIRQNAIGRQPAEQDRSLLAWDRVLEAIREHGGYQTVKFDDLAIHAAIRSCGGWVALCEQETEQMITWTKKAFCDAYRAHIASGMLTAAAAARLPGIIAADRANAGYDQPEAIEVTTHLPAIKIRVADTPAPTKKIADKPEYYRVGQRVAEPLFESSPSDEPAKTTMTIDEQRAKIQAAKQALREKYGD